MAVRSEEVVETAVSEKKLRFEVPLYTLAEAARALDVPSTTFATWARGDERPGPGRTAMNGAAIVTTVAGDPGRPAIPFVGLAEGMVLAAVRRAGVPMQRVRPALAVLARELGVEHALASQRLYTDGAELLFDFSTTLDDRAAVAARELVVVRSGQRVFHDVIDQYLKRIEYAGDGYPRLIHLPAYDRADVVVDPGRSFGQPIFAHGGARIEDVLSRFWAGEDIAALSEEFGVPEPEIEDVLRAASRKAA